MTYYEALESKREVLAELTIGTAVMFPDLVEGLLTLSDQLIDSTLHS
jgi:hypothetical protein